MLRFIQYFQQPSHDMFGSRAQLTQPPQPPLKIHLERDRVLLNQVEIAGLDFVLWDSIGSTHGAHVFLRLPFYRNSSPFYCSQMTFSHPGFRKPHHAQVLQSSDRCLGPYCFLVHRFFHLDNLANFKPDDLAVKSTQPVDSRPRVSPLFSPLAYRSQAFRTPIRLCTGFER